MPLLDVTEDRAAECLRDVGLQARDGLLVHSAVQFLGRPAGGVGMYLDAIQTVIGPQGTVAAPVFNFDFARGTRYDPQTSPSRGMGAFSEHVRQHPDSLRTRHPMQSLAVLGYSAADLAQRDTPSAFSPGSAYDRMLSLDFKILLLGADIKYVSMVHYSEERASVPYRYWKDFTGQILIDGRWEARTVQMFVRDLVLDPQLSLAPIQDLLQARDQWRSVTLNYGQISACRLADFVGATDHILAKDPWALVTNRPDERPT